jgi:hypothetical protein
MPNLPFVSKATPKAKSIVISASLSSIPEFSREEAQAVETVQF